MTNKKTKNKQETFYITTPIYYSSGDLHIGHCYTTVNCDAISRYHRYKGHDVVYSTGTDEHGQKIAKAAQSSGKTCKQYVDERAEGIVALWAKCDVQYDKFIRTTDTAHESAVQAIFKKLYDRGDIYKGSYKGKYCVPCESFWTETQLNDGKCPDCNREVVDSEEECYFFRLSRYSDRILDLLTKTKFLEPQSRVNEMVSFIKDGLTDLAVTRTSVEWGVKVPWDTNHSIYVWIDALSNYITLLGYDASSSKQSAEFAKYWPANVHMVGKEIVRFHAIIWPAILMALGLPIPQKVYGHGWLLFDGDKMSKSKGNIVDPVVLIDKYGLDAFRYYLLSEIPFGSDGSYTLELYLNRINTDLVNDYGNLVRRSFAMATQYFGSRVTSKGEYLASEDEVFVGLISKLPAVVDGEIRSLNIAKALDMIFKLIRAANKYIDITKPWVLAKDGNNSARLMSVIFNLLEAIRIASALLVPFVTIAPKKVLDAMQVPLDDYNASIAAGCVAVYKLGELDVLYPRIDIAHELDAVARASADDAATKKPKAIKNSATSNNTAQKEASKVVDKVENISIDEFCRSVLRVGVIKECKSVERSKKLLEILVDIGGECRTILSGIANSYTPQELLGKQVVVVTNLAPVKICGIVSNGMILAAVDGERAVLLSPERLVASGSEID